MISTNSAKHKPTRMNMSVVLRADFSEACAPLRGAARLTMPISKVAIAPTKVSAMTYAKGWLNIGTKLRRNEGAVK